MSEQLGPYTISLASLDPRQRDALSDLVIEKQQLAFKIGTIEAKLTALTRSLQQIANLDPNNFNAANQAVQMAKTALLIPIPKK